MFNGAYSHYSIDEFLFCRANFNISIGKLWWFLEKALLVYAVVEVTGVIKRFKWCCLVGYTVIM